MHSIFFSRIYCQGYYSIFIERWRKTAALFFKFSVELESGVSLCVWFIAFYGCSHKNTFILVNWVNYGRLEFVPILFPNPDAPIRLYWALYFVAMVQANRVQNIRNWKTKKKKPTDSSKPTSFLAGCVASSFSIHTYPRVSLLSYTHCFRYIYAIPFRFTIVQQRITAHISHTISTQRHFSVSNGWRFRI